MYNPCLFSKTTIYYPKNEIIKNGTNYLIKYDLKNNSNETQYKYDFSFEMYVNKMPDSAAYSKNTQNMYLSSVSVIGESHWGEGLNFFRLRLRYSFDTEPENILSAEYNVRELLSNKQNNEIKIYKSSEQWSSRDLTWNTKVSYSELLSSQTSQNGEFNFDITEFVKACFSDRESLLESRGGVLVGDNGSFSVLASSDNSFYIPYVKIKLDKLPESFSVVENINPPEF